MVTKVDDSTQRVYREPVTLSTPRSIVAQVSAIADGRYDMDENPHAIIRRLAAMLRDAILCGAVGRDVLPPGDGVLPCVRDEA